MLIGRSALAEAARNFLASLLATTAMAFFVLSITFLKRTPGVGMSFLLEFFPLFFPLALQFTVPLAMLTAAVLTFGRIAGDGELTALAASGIHPKLAVRPVLAGAAVVAVLAFAANDLALPYAAHQLRMAKRDLPHQLRTSFRAGLRDFDFGRGHLSFESFDGESFRDVCFEYRRKDGSALLLRAREGSMTVTDDDRVVLRLREGRSVEPHATSHGEAHVAFDDIAYEVTVAELVEGGRRRRKHSGLRSWELAYVSARDLQPAAGRRVTAVRAREEFARRSALAGAVFFFTLIGIPLGVMSAGGGRVAAFLTAIAPVLLLYFPLVIAGSNLARSGKVPALPALWSGNVVVGAVGLLLLRRLYRR